MRLTPSHRLRWVVVVTLAAATPGWAACSAAPVGTLYADGLGGVAIQGVVRPPDDRGVATGPTVANNSQTEPITFGAVQLIGAQGIELIDAFTTDMDHQMAVGTWVPPRSDDTNGSGLPEQMANWALRTPLDQTVLGPGEVKALMLVVRPTSPDNCLCAQGFRLNYREFGRDLSVVSNEGMIVYHGPDDSGAAGGTCADVSDFIVAHPLG